MLLAGILLLSSVATAEPMNKGETTLWSLTPDVAVDAAPQWRLLETSSQSMRLECVIPGLRHRVQNVAGETWHELSLDGGGLTGVEGAPCLPTIGQLVAISKWISARQGVMRLCGLSPHNEEILRGILSLDDAQLARLREEGVIK